jgi:peptidoglycan/xylan/chitin deacetylase (PgdA/CDA1 family)
MPMGLRRVTMFLSLAASALFAGGCGAVQRVLLPVIEGLGPAGLYRVEVGQEKVIALTIDDGPSAHTHDILDQLALRGATATFFIHPEHLEAMGVDGEAAVRRILDEGHEIGNHTLRDVPSAGLDREAFEQSFLATHETLCELGVEPRWFRAAGGSYKPATMAGVMQRHGYEPRFVMASFFPWDTFLHLPATYGKQLGTSAFPGAIVVLHEGIGKHADRGPRTLRSLRRLLEECQRRGYRVRSLSEVVDLEL